MSGETPAYRGRIYGKQTVQEETLAHLLDVGAPATFETPSRTAEFRYRLIDRVECWPFQLLRAMAYQLNTTPARSRGGTAVRVADRVIALATRNPS